MSWSEDGISWKDVDGGVTFEGNTDKDSVETRGACTRALRAGVTKIMVGFTELGFSSDLRCVHLIFWGGVTMTLPLISDVGRRQIGIGANPPGCLFSGFWTVEFPVVRSADICLP